MQTDGYVTAAKLKDTYLGIGVRQETLLKLFEQHNAEFEKKVGHSRAQGTFTRYRTVCNHIREFLPHTYKREDIPLKELNLTFINDFEYFLRTEKKCRTNTMWGYMIVLKHIVSIARNDGRLPFNPFAGYINSPESVDRGYLTQTEIQTLMDAPIKNTYHELVRDLFVFSVFTGLAYSDVKNLTTDNLQTFFDGNLWIITRRKKTNTESNIRLLDVPKRIMEKYKGLARDGHVFPVPSNGSCNKILKEIGRQCGFKVRLTYHTARHTNATTVLAAANIAESVGSLFGSNKVKALERENTVLQNRIIELEEEVRQREQQQAKQMQEMKSIYEQQNSKLSEFVDFVKRYFPYVEKLIPTINFLRDRLGFDDGIIRRLCTFKDVAIKGKLYSSEFNQSFETKRSVCAIKENENGKFDFNIDRVPHVSWFRKKMSEFREAIGIPKPRQNRSIKL